MSSILSWNYIKTVCCLTCVRFWNIQHRLFVIVWIFKLRSSYSRTIRPNWQYVNAQLVCDFCIARKDPPKTPYGYLDCGRGLVRVTVIYLEYTRPRGQARVYTFDIHRKSPRPEEYMWKLKVTLVKDYLKSLK